MSDKYKSWLFVSVQAVLLGLLIFNKSNKIAPKSSFLLVGDILKILGFIILFVSFYDLRKSLTALPLPKKNGVLQVNGLYKFVRHPMYTGVLTLSLGITVHSGLYFKYALFILLYLLFAVKARYEEKLLIEKYSGYEKYMKITPRFIPKLHI